MKKRLIITFGSSVIQKISILALTVIAARLIGAVEFGKFAIVYATFVNLSGFIGDAIAATAYRYIPTLRHTSENLAKNAAKMIVSATVFLALCLALILIIAAPLFSHLINAKDDLIILFRLSGLIVFFSMSSAVFNAILHSYEKSFSASFVAICSSILIVSLSLLGAGRAGALGMCVGFAFGALFGVIANYYLVWRFFSIPFFNFENLKEFKNSNIVVKFTLPTMVTMALGGPVHWFCMSFLASSAGGFHQVAIFSAFFQWYSVFIFVPSALINFIIPWVAKSKINCESDIFKKRVFLIISLNLCIGISLFLIMWIFHVRIVDLYGIDFKGESRVLFLLAGCGFVASIITTMNQISWAVGRTWNNLFPAIINVFSYLFGTLYFVYGMNLGAIGLSYAILLATLLQCFVQLWMSLKNIFK